jgi:uncharacterized protein (DUF1778 family)
MSPAAATLERTAQQETEKKANINLRVSIEQRALIDTAAAAVGKTRTEFMLDSATQHAIDVLLDRTVFALSSEQHDALMRVLQSPPKPTAALKKLMSSKSPWEK